MHTVFTLCSNNYLAQAIVLGNSVKLHHPAATFLIVLVDVKTQAIDYSEIPFEVLPANAIEPQIQQLARKYDIIELNTCIKPRVIEYLMQERDAERVTYLDPDIKVYSPLAELSNVLDRSNVALTPHALTPVPLDGKTPTENTFLRHGIYNLGFIALKRSHVTLELARWWKARTYAAGRDRPEAGEFVDQLYVNLLPILFDGVSVLRHEGYNMAPWNLHERHLRRRDGAYWVNGSTRLVFFHFSSLRIDSGELPVHYYNRFTMKDRPDLVDLYTDYYEELKSAGYFRYSGIAWAYRNGDTPEPRNGLGHKVRALFGSGVVWGLRQLPASVRDRAYQLIRNAWT